MNTTIESAVELAKGIVESVGSVTDVDIAVCPPYTNLSAVAAVLKGSNVRLGAQDVHWEEKGAYTGKISCAMLKSAGVEYVIIGHSEQRSYFHETDETVNSKIKAALGAGLLPIICVGETIEIRKAGKVEEVLQTQVQGALEGLSDDEVKRCTIAYEPVWAIGTGETATPQQANEAHAFIRSLTGRLYSEEIAQGIRIQYGGSMKPSNAAELLGQSDVDGGLIGGASLKVEDFKGIIIPSH
jgi:triosephosphate isomerase